MKTHSGLFWEPVPKAVKQERQKPNPFWLEPGYVPPYKHQPYELMTDKEIRSKQGELVCDIELYPNYFLAAFLSLETGKVICIEDDMEKLNWILHNYKIITFNGNNFDIPIMALAIAGKSIEELKYAADMIIGGLQGWHIYKAFNIEKPQYDHIDIIEVCPLKASLKIYGGRLHVPRMQDLPFPPESNLTTEQIEILKNYCVNDLVTTAIVYSELEEQIGVREQMTKKYGIDLRSKSDAQVAEAVIKKELEAMSSQRLQVPSISPGTMFQYQVPSFLSFQTDVMKDTLRMVRSSRFVVADSGKTIMPDHLKDAEIKIGKGIYRMGIGGLHSSETNVSYKADDNFKIVDRDVTSYYPAIILNQGLYPKHLGRNFLSVYRSLVSRRIAAKKAGNRIEADMFKICVNGSFGKLGSRYSVLYSPDLLIQVTLTGQLSLLMLIEALEEKGIQVCSANTDGIVMRYPKSLQHIVDDVVHSWERTTGFDTEETEYSAIYIRDINNYLAIKGSGAKTKGAYSIGEGIFRFHKNPTNSIVVEAVTEYLTKDVPVRDTIRSCTDFTKFLTVRAVKGGAVKDKNYLGKAIRWYYSKTTSGDIVYALNGNKVPKSENAQPCMELPDEFPDDVDYARYEIEAMEILKDIAAL